MAEPAAPSPSQAEQGNDEIGKSFDAEMEDVLGDNTKNAQEGSSSTLDNEAMPSDTQNIPALPHNNRKDTTLREFLSKMDDYAPIVCPSLSPPYQHAVVLHQRPQFAEC